MEKNSLTSSIKIWKIVFLLGVLIGAYSNIHTANAQTAQFSGKYLLYVCGSNEKGKELVEGGHVACQSYIAGIIDYHTILKSMGSAPGIDFCIPKSAGLTDIQKRVYAYIARRRSQHENFIVAPGVALALNTYYPCKKR